MRSGPRQADIASLYKRMRFADVEIVTLSEGVISDLHIGLKGTMDAHLLKDLADKTRRGLRGRVEAGKSGGGRRQLGISRGSPEQVIDGWRHFGYAPLEGILDGLGAGREAVEAQRRGSPHALRIIELGGNDVIEDCHFFWLHLAATDCQEARQK